MTLAKYATGYRDIREDVRSVLGLEVESHRVAGVLQRGASVIIEPFPDGAYALPDICSWTKSAADLVDHVIGRTSLVEPRVTGDTFATLDGTSW